MNSLNSQQKQISRVFLDKTDFKNSILCSSVKNRNLTKNKY